MRVRRARPEDLAAVGEVTLAAYAEFSKGDLEDYADHLRDAARRDRQAEVWVATPDDTVQILGSVTICPEGSVRREIAKPGEGEFRMLAVAPEARGLGVGTALLDIVVDRSRGRGAPTIVMSTQEVMRSAHRLDEAAGFVRAPELDWSPNDHVHLIGYRLDISS